MKRNKKGQFIQVKNLHKPRIRRGKRRKNPARKIAKAPKYGYDASKRAHRKIQHQRVKTGLAAPFVKIKYFVQVKRAKGWFSLGGFTSKEYAADYGNSLARKYTGQAFRVYWK